MDIIVWFMGNKEDATASAVTKAGTLALSSLIFVESPVYVVRVGKTPKEFIEGLPEGIVACLYIDGLLQELDPKTKCLQ